MASPTAPRPIALPVSPDHIPSDLEAAPQFVGWRYEWRNEAWTKPRICIATGQHASPTDPQTWTTSELAVLAYRSDTHDSTVVIWSGHIGSYEDQAPLLGKYLRKDLVNRGTLG